MGQTCHTKLLIIDTFRYPELMPVSGYQFISIDLGYVLISSLSYQLSTCLLIYVAPIGLAMELGSEIQEILIDKTFGNGEMAENRHDA